MKKIRKDKPSRVIIHTYMEISQGNSPCSYLYLKLKCFVFHFLFSLFSLTKLENRRAEQVLLRERAGTHGRGEVLWKRGKRVNMLQ
jgi:hypothetical protein